MLVVNCEEYLEKVKKFATENNILPKLEDVLKYLDEMCWFGNKARCFLYKDFAPNSFEFCLVDENDRPVMGGGVIFYAGSESGVGGPQFSVTMSGRTDSRWEIHT